MYSTYNRWRAYAGPISCCVQRISGFVNISDETYKDTVALQYMKHLEIKMLTATKVNTLVSQQVLSRASGHFKIS